MLNSPRTFTRKAYAFAAFMAMLWVFFAIGAWYASRFDALLGLAPERPSILFGATFAVWFVSLFGYIGLRLLVSRPAPEEHVERYV